VQDVPPPDNLYDLIGVDANADPGAIKRAYYDKQKICHPDIAGPEGEEMCILLNDAYDVLSQEDSRRAYDEKLSVQSPSAEEPVEVDTDFSPNWQRAYGDEDPNPYDDDFVEYNIFDERDAVWQGERPPVWSGRPLSASSWDRVEPEGRGGKWQDQRFAYVDPYTCINCHNCVDCAPSTFYIDYFYGKARVHTQWGDAEEDIDWAVMSCPVDCIYWVSREELQYLEFTTAKDLYDNGGEMANAMLGGTMEDPFTKAKQYKERRKRKLTNQVTRGLGQLDKVSKKIRAAFARLPAVLRVQGWAKRRSLTQ
jgi:ferredoxin